MSALRTAREAAGLSQAAVASASGLSRQAVGAIESGRHRPSVDAALALARALDVSVEALFGTAEGDVARPVLDPVGDGRGVLAARVGATMVYADAARALAVDGWPRPNAVLRGGRPQPLPGGDLDGLVLVGCDPAVALAASMLPAAGPRHVHVLSGSTGRALDAMTGGRAHAALVHDRVDRLPAAPAGVLRLHLARWRVGIATRGRRTLEELLARRVRIVQREDGASTQKALRAAAAASGTALAAGPRAGGHLEVAQRVRDGAPAGVTMEPAARCFGLGFQDLEEHVAEVWVDGRHRRHPAVEALAASLRSSAFTDRLALVGGYDVEQCGATR